MTIINKVAMKFIDNIDFDHKINDILSIIGDYLNVCRIYIFLDSLDATSTSNTHEWCNTDVKAQKDNLQNLEYSKFLSWRKLLEIQGRIVEHDINNLPDEIIEILEVQDIKSIVVFPIKIDNKQVGFVGIDACRKNRFWTDKEIDLISTFAFMLSSTYEKELEKNALKEFKRNFKSFFDSVDGCLIVSDMNGKILYVNNRFKKNICSNENLIGKSVFKVCIKDIDKDKDNLYSVISSGNYYKREVRIENLTSTFPAKMKSWKGEYNGEDCIFTMIKNISHEKELENKFSKIFRRNPAPMAITDIVEYEFIDVNDAFLDSMGYIREDVIGKTAEEVGIFNEERFYLAVLEKVNEGRNIENISVKVNRADGKVIDGLLFGEIIKSKDKELLVTVFVDVSEQAILYKLVNNQKIRLENIIDSIRAGTWEWDLISDEMVINDRWAEIIGYTVEELEPININTWKRFVQIDDFVKAQALLKDHFNKLSDFYEAEFRMRHKSGKWIWVLSKGKITKWSEDGLAQKMFGTHTDITEIKIMQQKIKEVSIKDSLTGLYNRGYFIEYLSHMLEEYEREMKNFSIAIVDIDYFKKVNDTYGHLCGDFVLKEFSKKLVNSLRSYDIVARYGGEEFIILFRNSNRENSVRILNRILKSMEETYFTYEDNDINIAFSGGVSDADELLNRGISVEVIIGIADERLYQAKNTGRNKII